MANLQALIDIRDLIAMRQCKSIVKMLQDQTVAYKKSTNIMVQQQETCQQVNCQQQNFSSKRPSNILSVKLEVTTVEMSKESG